MSGTKSITIATAHSEWLNKGPARCQLLVLEGPDQGKAIPIQEHPILLGTAEDCDLILTDERISRHHLRIQRDEMWFIATDLESRNGTLFEGAQIKESRLRPGATLKLGHTFVRIQPQPQELSITPSQSRSFGDLVAESFTMREVFAALELVSLSDVTVLLEGETGTGKEIAARSIHEASDRHKGPFVAIDCGALPPTLLESEFFGHVKGAFTGAESQRAGAFLRAQGGTLFLDELDHIPPAAQARLLRAIEERRIRPVGADKEHDIDVRIIAASQIDLDTHIAEGTFRPDLYYRLSVVRIKLPPLRERREDIAPITRALLKRRGIPTDPTPYHLLDKLMAHDWPGNVRELRNVIERSIALSPHAKHFADLHIHMHPITHNQSMNIRTDLPYSEAKQQLIQQFECAYLKDAYARHDGNLSAISRDIQLDRKHLRNLLKKHDLI